MANCSKCGETCETSGRYCRKCRAEYMRSWRKAAKGNEEAFVRYLTKALAHAPRGTVVSVSRTEEQTGTEGDQTMNKSGIWN